MLLTTLWYLAFILSFALLSVAGAILWRRFRSSATLLVAVGFTFALLEQLMALTVTVEFRSMLRAHPDASCFLPHLHLVAILGHYTGLLGLWSAAVGLLWHAGRPASSNQRLERPVTPGFE